MQFRAREQRRNTGFQPVRSAGFPACQMAWWRSLNGERLSQAGSPLTAQAGSPRSASRPPRQLHGSGLGSGESRLYTVTTRTGAQAPASHLKPLAEIHLARDGVVDQEILGPLRDDFAFEDEIG